MDTVLWLIQVCVKPFFYLLFLFLFIVFFIKPLLSYLTVFKIIRDQKNLQREYRKQKEKLEQDRKNEHEESFKKAHEI